MIQKGPALPEERQENVGVKRVYVEKKPDFAVRAQDLAGEIRSYLGIEKPP